jgi:hypothetical protein
MPIAIRGQAEHLRGADARKETSDLGGEVLELA